MTILSRTTLRCAVSILVLLSLHLLNGQDDKALTNADAHGGDWLTTGRDYAETRYSPLNQINASNAGRLGLAWSYDTGSAPGRIEATPIVANGTLYTTLTSDVVIAVDARTGKLQWRYDPDIGGHNSPPGSQNGPPRARKTGPNRGVAIYEGKVYLGLVDGRLLALDAGTGKLVWQVQTTPLDSDYTITGAPRIVRGKVIIGNTGGENALRGYVTAYDAESGKQVWRTYTVPGDPSKPQQSKALEAALKTWKGDQWYKLGGGGNAWDAFAYDPDLNLIYFGTANGSPWDQNWRSPGGGANLYVCSIIALHADTGKYAWYFQETPGDEWDYDAVQDLILADLRIGGELQKVIMQASKNGFFYVLNRKTGHFISARPFAYVTWATGVDPKTGRPIEAPNARYDTKGVFLSPSNFGGHNWQTMSFNPNTGLAYLPADNGTFYYREDPSHFVYKPGLVDRGLSLDPGLPFNARPQPTPPPGMPKGYFSYSLLAWDPVTQKEAWQVPGLGLGGSTMTTGGSLVFSSSTDGLFAAFSADKGKKLWQAQLVPGFASPVTYMLDGKQYVSVLTGSSNARVYTFALDANLPIPTAPAPRASAAGRNRQGSALSAAGAAQAPAAGRTTQGGVYSDDQAAKGKAEYSQNCAACHMADLSGNGEAVPLTGDAFTRAWNGHTADELFNAISTTMPQGNPGSLSPETYADILAYIFKSNGLPSGPDELKSDPEILKLITIN